MVYRRETRHGLHFEFGFGSRPAGALARWFQFLRLTKRFDQSNSPMCSARARNTARGGACAPHFNCIVPAKGSFGNYSVGSFSKTGGLLVAEREGSSGIIP